ncbi:DUF4832 domain-containing protein [candidate division KSB1 bacterium]
MRLRRLSAIGLLSILVLFSNSTILAQETVVVRPVVTDELLMNPGKGFATFQHFNGDSLFPGRRWSEEGPTEFSDKITNLENVDYPQTSLSYCRWYWEVLEPKRGEYRWDIIDNALLAAHRRGQQLQIRFMPQDRRGTKLPAWYMEIADGFKMKEGDREIWQPNYNDPKFLAHWGALIRACGQRYDGHPWLDMVDIGALGFWGEWHTGGRPGMMPPFEVREKVIDVYLESFTRTPLIMLLGYQKDRGYAVARGAGWRVDCLGDMGDGRYELGWCHMLDFYPHKIVRALATDVWKRAPVILETCGVYGSWHEKGYDIDYIHQEALRWHVSSINAKSSAVPKEWMPEVEEFIKKMGYRLEPRKVAYPSKVVAGTQMPLEMWWVNVGVAPPYRRYNVVLQLKNDKSSGLIRIDTDVTCWLPGDDVVLEETVWVPDLAPGVYEVRLGLLDPFSGKPVIKLPVQGRGAGGDNWHDLGEIELLPWELEK